MVGILLAAGRGSRFDPSGVHNKLLQPLANGEALAVASAKKLLAVLPRVVAVLRPGEAQLAAALEFVLGRLVHKRGTLQQFGVTRKCLRTQ